MHLIAHRRGLGVAYPISNPLRSQSFMTRFPNASFAGSSQPRIGATSQDASGNVYTYGANGWQLTTATSLPTTPGTSLSAAAQPYLGQTYQDPSGNIYTYGSAGWQLTQPAASGSVPTTAAQSTPASATGFPSNPVIGQTYTDSAGNVWTYGSSGWTETTPAASSGASWFTDSTLISGVPNYWLVAGGGLLLILLMKGKR
jgi:hypothetical protein